MAATTLMSSIDEPFERFFADEYRRAVAIAQRITRDAAEAEDVAQEVFVRCARSGRAGERGWLYTAIVHTALNAIRTRRRRSLREQQNFRLGRAVSESAQNAADPQTIVQRQHDDDTVRDALMRLSRRDAEILALRYSGLSYRELAQMLHIDAAQIGTRLARAERALKKEIERGTLG